MEDVSKCVRGRKQETGSGHDDIVFRPQTEFFIVSTGFSTVNIYKGNFLEDCIDVHRLQN